MTINKLTVEQINIALLDLQKQIDAIKQLVQSLLSN